MAASAPKLNPFRRVALYWRETMEELRKASWPDYQELSNSTIVIIIAVLLLGAFISISDFSLIQLVEFLTRLITAK